MADEVRKCRLRPEFAHLNEELTPDVWVPAREWAERLVVRARKARLLSIHQRMLDPQPLRVSRRWAANPPVRTEPPGRFVSLGLALQPGRSAGKQAPDSEH
jgi:hypothetical protein